MSKILLVDVETTGLDPQLHEIIEIGAIVFDSHTFEIEQTYEQKVIPLRMDLAEPKALEVNGYQFEEWADAIALEEALRQLNALANNTVFMAFNAHFDLSFIEHGFKCFGIKPAYRWYPICLRAIAWHVMPHTGMFKWSMKEVCEKLGIEPEPAVHRALNGVMKEFEIYKELCRPSTHTSSAS